MEGGMVNKGEHQPGLSCSFCGKGQREVARLQCAISLFICSECVQAGSRLLVGEAIPGCAVTRVEGSTLSCAVCGLAHAPSFPMLVPTATPGAPGMCAECFALAQDIEAEELKRRGAT